MTISGFQPAMKLLAWFSLAAISLLASFGCDSSNLNVVDYCSIDSDCPSGYYCQSGYCENVCIADEDCPSGYVCQNRVCIKDPKFDEIPTTTEDGDEPTEEGEDPVVADGDDEIIAPPDGDEEASDMADGDSDEAEEEAMPVACETDEDCQNDTNPCTLPFCDTETGQCAWRFNPEGVCEQPDTPCVTMRCNETVMECVSFNNDGVSCDDGDRCNGRDICEEGVCTHPNEVVCPPCRICDPQTGACVCDDSGTVCDEPEVCDNVDNDCDGATDEGEVCGETNLNLLIELRWPNEQADLDLHVLRPGGVLGEYDDVDENDCYYNNPSPDWGILGDDADNPQFGSDVLNGGGGDWESMQPESVFIAMPADENLRVLVHFVNHGNSRPPAGQTQVKLSVHIRENLVAEFDAELNEQGSFWNALCINPETENVNPILNPDGSKQIAYNNAINEIDPRACTGGAVCNVHCDCAQGMACAEGVCVQSNPPVYCCENSGCPSGSACSGVNNEPGYCGFVANFDWSPNSSELDNRVIVNEEYVGWGMLFSTTRRNSSVATDTSWTLNSVSRGNSASTMDADGARWLGDIIITLVEPHNPERKMLANEISFYVGETYDNGLILRAYNSNGFNPDDPEANMVVGGTIDGTGKISIPTDEPIHEFRISPYRDPNFVIDDVQVDALYAP